MFRGILQGGVALRNTLVYLFEPRLRYDSL